MRRLLHFVAPPLLVAVASAQVVTIPLGTATTDGDSLDMLPWGRATSGGLQMQCIYDSSNLTLQGVLAPVLVWRLRWRANAAPTTTAWTGGTYTSATVRMSTCPFDALTPSTTFTANHGADLTTVYAGPVDYAGGNGGAGVPGMTVVDLTLTTPFVYDPNGGDLNIEVEFQQGVWIGGTVTPLDVQSAGSLSSRVFTLNQGATTGMQNINHGPVVTLDCAPVGSTRSTVASYGSGCYTTGASFYEHFATAGWFDLQHSSMAMLATGSGYMVLSGIGVYVAPSAPSILRLTHNAQITVGLGSAFPFPGGSTTQLTVCANGCVAVAPGNGIAIAPAVDAFLGAPQTAWWCWHDLNPSATGSGQVLFEEVGSTSYVTWDGVADAGSPSASNRFQLQFDRMGGHVIFVWEAMSAIGNSGFLVGYSPGGPSIDPGNRDLSVALATAFPLPTADVTALALAAGARPALNTVVPLTTANIPAGSPFAVTVLSAGQVNPGIDLGFLGAPGCRQLVAPGSSVLFVAPALSTVLNVLIPNVPGFAGMQVHCQAASISPGVTALGLLTSNGVTLSLGHY